MSNQQLRVLMTLLAKAALETESVEENEKMVEVVDLLRVKLKCK